MRARWHKPPMVEVRVYEAHEPHILYIYISVLYDNIIYIYTTNRS